jgi:hypothetical protein
MDEQPYERTRMPFIAGARRRQAVMWIATLAGIAAAGATIQLTRAPDFVWWTSPPIGETGRHVCILVPQGWECRAKILVNLEPLSLQFDIVPIDRRPAFLRRLLPRRVEAAKTVIGITHYQGRVPDGAYDNDRTMRLAGDTSHRIVIDRHSRITSSVFYSRTDRAAFDATYTLICNSLRIE